MIDLKKVRENIEGYKEICKNKGKEIDVDTILAKDDQRKDLQKQIDDLKFQQKKFGEEKKYDEAKALKIEIQTKEEEYKTIVENLNKDLLKMPNTSIHPDIPVGKNDSENVVTKTV